MGVLKSNVVVGVSAALAVTVLVPVLRPVARTIGRPIAKSLLKGGLMLYERGREAMAVAGESVEDMVAEIRAEEPGAVPAETASPVAAPPQPQAEAGREQERGRRPGMAAV